MPAPHAPNTPTLAEIVRAAPASWSFYSTEGFSTERFVAAYDAWHDDARAALRAAEASA